VHDLGDVIVVAPKEQQSGMGRSLPGTMNGAIFVEDLAIDGDRIRAYSVPGSPAQSVLYGILELCDSRRPDVVISGINYGENIGTCVTISGTVGAALQAADMGVFGLAVSLETNRAYHKELGYDVDWHAAAHFTRLFTQLALRNELPHDVDVLKVDVPEDATPATPWRVTRQSRLSYYEPQPSQRTRLEETLRLPYLVSVPLDRVERDSDVYVFAVSREVSVTPLSVDLTSRVNLPALEQLLRE
jgi:5'-nucleotidase